MKRRLAVLYLGPVLIVRDCVLIVFWKDQFLETIVDINGYFSDIWVLLSRKKGLFMAHQILTLASGVIVIILT